MIKYKGSLWTFYEELYANKLRNTEEMGNFLDSHNLPKLHQEDIDNLNIHDKHIFDEVIKNHPTSRSPGPEGFTTEF